MGVVCRRGHAMGSRCTDTRRLEDSGAATTHTANRLVRMPCPGLRGAWLPAGASPPPRCRAVGLLSAAGAVWLRPSCRPACARPPTRAPALPVCACGEALAESSSPRVTAGARPLIATERLRSCVTGSCNVPTTTHHGTAPTKVHTRDTVSHCRRRTHLQSHVTSRGARHTAGTDAPVGVVSPTAHTCMSSTTARSRDMCDGVLPAAAPASAGAPACRDTNSSGPRTLLFGACPKPR